MPRQAPIIRVLIASPKDVGEMRSMIPPLFTEWNSFGNRQAMLEPVMFEHAGVPELGSHPQDVIDRQLVVTSDLLVAIFWTQIGTATERHISGTIQEIETFIEEKGPKRVMVYFIDKPINARPMDLDVAQIQQLKDYRRKLEKEGLLCIVPSEGDLRLRLYQHLESKVNALLRQELPEPVKQAERSTADERDDHKWPCDATI